MKFYEMKYNPVSKPERISYILVASKDATLKDIEKMSKRLSGNNWVIKELAGKEFFKHNYRDALDVTIVDEKLDEISRKNMADMEAHYVDNRIGKISKFKKFFKD